MAAPQPDPLSRSSEYYFDDGTVVIRVENTLYKARLHMWRDRARVACCADFGGLTLAGVPRRSHAQKPSLL